MARQSLGSDHHCGNLSGGNFSCLTGYCGTGKVECDWYSPTSTTLVEFQLDGSQGMDFYVLSLVNGFNLPILVVPEGDSRDNCTSVRCVADLNERCPSELRVTTAGGERVACKSACQAFGENRYCCTGEYAGHDKCRPNQYTQVFEKACPEASSSLHDRAASLVSCAGADYTITFCPSSNAR
ncbi:PR5-like receptor kinase [Sesamum alatum]|uniref:PR5-like receptor kinase n=1 Tax=Sesamum alatum TaxID=300844 RepID=A0AAE2CV03_9LAMI|nr:PR5-like receptor kinase [Sesamum alatum]